MDETPASRQYVGYVDPLGKSTRDLFRGPGPASPRSLYPSPRSFYPRLGHSVHYRDRGWVRTPGSGSPWVRPRSPILADWKNEYGPGYRAYSPPGAIAMAPGIYGARPSTPRSPQFGYASPRRQVLYAVERQHGFSPAKAYGEWQQTMHAHDVMEDRMEIGLQRQRGQQAIMNPSYQQTILPLSEFGKSEASPAGAALLHAEEEKEGQKGSLSAKVMNEVDAGTKHERDYFADCFRRQQKLSEDILKERELFTMKTENQKLQKNLRDMQRDQSEAIEIILKGQQRLIEQQRQIDDMYQRFSGARADDPLIDHMQTQIDRMQRQIHDMHQRASDVRAERQSGYMHQRASDMWTDDPLVALEESAELLQQREHSGVDKLSKMLDDHEALQRALQEVGKRAAQTAGHERELLQLRERNRRLEENLAAMLTPQTHGVGAPAKPAATKSLSASILKHQLDVMAKRVSDLGAIYSSNEQGLSCRPLCRQTHVRRVHCACATHSVHHTFLTTCGYKKHRYVRFNCRQFDCEADFATTKLSCQPSHPHAARRHPAASSRQPCWNPRDARARWARKTTYHRQDGRRRALSCEWASAARRCPARGRRRGRALIVAPGHSVQAYRTTREHGNTAAAARHPGSAFRGQAHQVCAPVCVYCRPFRSVFVLTRLIALRRTPLQGSTARKPEVFRR